MGEDNTNTAADKSGCLVAYLGYLVSFSLAFVILHCIAFIFDYFLCHEFEFGYWLLSDMTSTNMRAGAAALHRIYPTQRFAQTKHWSKGSALRKAVKSSRTSELHMQSRSNGWRSRQCWRSLDLVRRRG